MIERDKKLLPVLVNKQFEMKNINYSFEEIKKDGLVQVGKKKEWWYNHYKFDNEEEYMEWRKWMEEQIKRSYLGYDADKEAMYVDMVYGMTYRYKKEGQLF